MLCDRCSHILQGLPEFPADSQEIQHHADSGSFKAAIVAGCFICRALATEIADVERKLDDSAMTSFTVCRPRKDRAAYKVALYWVARRRGAKFGHVREIFLVPSEEIDRFSPSVDVEADQAATAKRRSHDLAKKWVHECTHQHPKCMNINAWKTHGVRYQPTRLLDLGGSDEKVWKLVLRDEEAGTHHQYATLSHRWSPDQQNLLLESNLEDFKQGQPVASLPQTFQDAISVALSLGVRYIWIDCLCIIQDSVPDWEVESLEMRRIYSNSVVNLSATGAPNNSFGFLDVLDKPLALLPQIRPPWISEVDAPWRVIDPFFWWAEVTKTPLMKRGWVFPERFLAPRVLHFGAQQMLWECASMDACEIYPDGLIDYTQSIGHTRFKNLDAFISTTTQLRLDSSSPVGSTPITQDPRLDDDLLQYWCDTVEAYTRTDLTQRNDKLIAVAGVAEMMSGLYKALGADSSAYAAGIFTHHILPMLEWHGHSPWTVRSKFATSGSRPPGYRAPSWSWASIDGRIFYEFLPGVLGWHNNTTLYRKELSWICHKPYLNYPRKHLGWKALVSDLTAQVQPTSGSPFGQIAGGSLHVRGRVVPITTIQSPNLAALLYEDPPFGPDQDVRVKYGLPLRCIDVVTSKRERSWWITGLMIQPVDDNRKTYQRCGLFFIPSSAGLEVLNIEISADVQEAKYSDGMILDNIEII